MLLYNDIIPSVVLVELEDDSSSDILKPEVTTSPSGVSGSKSRSVIWIFNMASSALLLATRRSIKTWNKNMEICTPRRCTVVTVMMVCLVREFCPLRY